MTNNNPQLPVPRPTIKQHIRMMAARLRKLGKPNTLNQHMVHFVYLCPSDISMDSVVTQTLDKTAAHLQAWYRFQMVDNETFSYDVRSYQTNHTASWYSTNDPDNNHAGAFWNNTLYDASVYANAGFYQPYNDWVIYVNATPAPDQYAGGTSGGYISGCAVLGAKDIASLQGIDPDWAQCRGIGGSGHEFGHTLGLPHPPAGDDFGKALMGTGYLTYPLCQLLTDNRNQLNSNPFLIEQPRVAPPQGLCPFDDSTDS